MNPCPGLRSCLTDQSAEGSVHNVPVPRQYEEAVKPSAPAATPAPTDSFPPPAPSEDGSYQGDAGESLADAFSEEMLTWFDEHEGVVKSGTLV